MALNLMEAGSTELLKTNKIKTMKTNFLASIVPFLLLALFSSSCSSINTPIEKKEGAEITLASYHEKTFRIKSNKPLEANDTTYFYMAYPIFSDSTINHYVFKNVVVDSGKTSVEDMGKAFITDYDKFYEEVEYKRAWYEEKEVSVIMQTGDYIGFQTRYESYTGGAHGIHYILYNNYDVHQNKEIKIKDLVNDYSGLTQVAEDFFRKQEGISKSHSLSEDYFFDEGVFSLPTNFTLKKDSILFLYNVYEIKPYVSGITELLIPYKAFQDLLTLDAKAILAEIKK